MKKLFATLAPGLALLLALVLLSSCGSAAAPASSPSSQPVKAELFAMDTVMDFTLYGEEALLQEAEARISELEQTFSVTVEQSDIARLNRGETVSLSPDTAALLTQGLFLCEATGGALDLSIYPVLRAWGFTTGDYAVPDDETLASLLENVDYRRLSYDSSGAFTLPEGMEIDLGSIAKGYTAQVLADQLRAEGVTSALLNLGGNVQTIGHKPDGSNWRIAIRDPGSAGNLGILQIDDLAVVTSGGYERYFEQEGKVYWHILDPVTGSPARTGLSSVTVVGSDGLQCDALSTALFVMGPERAADLWRNSASHGLADFEAVFVTDDGTVTVTEGLADRFTLLSGDSFEILTH